MGNAQGGRRSSLLPKQESSGSEGQGATKGGRASRQGTLTEEEEGDAGAGAGVEQQRPPPEQLTDRQKELLLENWRVVEGDIAKVGVITFISLFETHPDVQQVFLPFNGLPIDELKHSKQLRAHALRVMAFVQKAVARLNEPDKLESLTRELGKKHHGYGAKPKYVELIGPQFIQAIRPSLEASGGWSAEADAAWTALFALMGGVMKEAMRAEADAEEAARRAQ